MFLIPDCEFVYYSVYLTKHKNYCSMRLMSRLNQLNKQLLESLHLLITYVDFLPYFYPEQKNVSRAENFRMVYIEINA